MNSHRYLAKFIIEASSPLFIGSGQSSLLKDSLVYKDVNGFPQIPGTTLAGVVRHQLESSIINIDWNNIFGSSDNLSASRLIFSAGCMLLSNNLCSEGILEDSQVDLEIKNRFLNLPVRQHVKINHKGVAEKHALFDNEIVYKGTRFIFDVELMGDENDQDAWEMIMQAILNPAFRLGSGTRNGFGDLKVIALEINIFNLTQEKDFSNYLNSNISFNDSLRLKKIDANTTVSNGFSVYEIELTPDATFIFSEGAGDEDVDNRPLVEDIVTYDDNKINFVQRNVVPGSSIKGALLHRCAYHYNKFKGLFASNTSYALTNTAVVELFGSIEDNQATAGNVFFTDFYFEENTISNNKIFNHVAIDRFTGGGVDGALFSEKVSIGDKDVVFKTKIYVKNSSYSNFVLDAFENALIDVCKGLLPLGGMTTKGNGFFTGTLKRNGEICYSSNI